MERILGSLKSNTNVRNLWIKYTEIVKLPVYTGGKWSHPHKCKVNLLKILIPFFCTIVIISAGVAIIVIIRCKRQRKKLEAVLTRIRSKDAYVCYNFDNDESYVLETILPELKENCDPPFKLLIHSRDFGPGIQIIKNIENAIQNSNSAIIVMSQGFVKRIGANKNLLIVTLKI